MSAPLRISKNVEVLRNLPIDIDNEKNLISCLLRKPELLRDEKILFSIEDFHLTSHKKIVKAIIDLDADGIVPDPGMVANKLNDKDMSRDFVDDLMFVATSPANATHYAKALREVSSKRQALFDAEKLQKAALSGDLEEITRVHVEIAKREDLEHTGKTIWTDAFDICQQPLSAVEWLVDGLFPRNGAGTADGPPDSGKTSLVVNLCATIANSVGSWFGQDCLSGPVVVLGGEKSSHAVWRRDFERLGKVTRPGNFFIPELAGPLLKWNKREEVWVKTHAYSEAVRGIKRINPVLVIGDTIMRLAMGIDQSNNTNQAALGLELEKLAAEAGCLFLTIGHTNQASTKEALSWRLHYLSRAGGNGLPGVLRYCFGVTRIHRFDVEKKGELEGLLSTEDVLCRKIIACGVSKGNEIPPALWTNYRPQLFEIMPDGQMMMLNKDFPRIRINEEANEEVSVGYQDPFEGIVPRF
jgi:hypothetical protein